MGTMAAGVGMGLLVAGGAALAMDGGMDGVGDLAGDIGSGVASFASDIGDGLSDFASSW